MDHQHADTIPLKHVITEQPTGKGPLSVPAVDKTRITSLGSGTPKPDPLKPDTLQPVSSKPDQHAHVGGDNSKCIECCDAACQVLCNLPATNRCCYCSVLWKLCFDFYNQPNKKVLFFSQ